MQRLAEIAGLADSSARFVVKVSKRINFDTFVCPLAPKEFLHDKFCVKKGVPEGNLSHTFTYVTRCPRKSQKTAILGFFWTFLKMSLLELAHIRSRYSPDLSG